MATKSKSSTTSEHGSVARLFHPYADTWMDVEVGKEGDWLASGWTDGPNPHNRVTTYPALRDTDAKLAEVERDAKATDAQEAADAEAIAAAQASGINVETA